MFVFRTADGLYGAANADGEVVVEPEYQGIILEPPFIAAHLSDKEFEDECEKLAKKAGADKEPEDAETLHMKMNGRWISLWGKPVGAHSGMTVLKGSNSDPDDATFEVVDANGELIYVGKYDIVRSIEDDSNGGIFIKVLEGQKMKGEKRSFRMRPMSIFFIDKHGKLNENLPDGYSTRKSGYDNNVYLINPQGHEVYDYFWHN
ncbi:MAG: hypothetical protein ACI30K_07045 [Muribaculaceae bacterium]